MDKSKNLNANALKIVAIIAMTIDHTTDIFAPNYELTPLTLILHFIGRLTAPIMWYFVCEGFFYTKSLKKYIARMFAFAFVSHFAYCFCFGINPIPFVGDSFADAVFNRTSVMWGLAWALVMLYVWNKTKLKMWQKMLILLPVLALTFPANWSCISVMAILYMYDYRGNFNKQFAVILFWSFLYGLVSFFFYSRSYGIITLGVVFIYPLLKLYNGERGKAKWLKWFFYLYYPLHLALLGVLRLALYGNSGVL